jgi:2-phosphoglycerate kinase
MSDEEKAKAVYFDAVATISIYIAERARNRPAGVVREKYLEQAYSETFKNIKTSVRELVKK